MSVSRKKTDIYSENGQTTLIIEVGEYDEPLIYSHYTTATVKNFGTSEQEITFERSIKSAEEAYKIAERYKTSMNNYTLIFIITIFAIISIIGILIKCAPKRNYIKE